jgi:hypothetical protein
MKSYLILVLSALFLCVSCINNPLDSISEEEHQTGKSIRYQLTKSNTAVIEDSLTVMSKLQKDVNHLMMNRIIFKDSVYVLSIKREDAIFLGVPEDTYDKYVDYVNTLNTKVTDL